MVQKFGPVPCPKKATIHDLFDFSKISKTFYSEKLHIHYSKYILSVHKRSSNFAVFSELARYPIQVNILLSALLVSIRNNFFRTS